MNESPIKLSALAGSSLQKLYLHPNFNNTDSLDTAEIARLGDLRELTLEKIAKCTGAPLRNPELSRITIIHCKDDPELFLFTPGGLPALGYLCLSDCTGVTTGMYAELQSPESEREQTMLRLRQVGKVLLSLPKLQTLCGRHRLLATGIIDWQNDWKQEVRVDCFSSVDWSCSNCCRRYALWSRELD